MKVTVTLKVKAKDGKEAKQIVKALMDTAITCEKYYGGFGSLWLSWEFAKRGKK
jgi:hypothetical protein